MDFKQLEYIVKIAEEKNITHAAEKIFITQSALNQQLLKLEKELGTQLFNRERNNWSLTNAGKIYIENAKQILKIKKDTYNEIYDQLDENHGELRIGLSPGRGIELFASIFKKLHDKYPKLIVKPVELQVRLQQQQIEEGELDIGFMTLTKPQRKSANHEMLYSEEMVLAISKDHPYNLQGNISEKVDLTLFKDQPFVLMDKTSTNREMIDMIFKENGFIPNILFETKFTTSIVTTIGASVCCGIVPEYYANTYRDKISCFRIKGAPTWDIVISYKKGSYLSKPAKEFIELAKEFFHSKKN